MKQRGNPEYQPFNDIDKEPLESLLFLEVNSKMKRKMSPKSRTYQL